MNQYFIQDARKINELPISSNVDLIITSPPYFDMKDYGSKNQIGFGQNYDSYLKDLEAVFDKCFYITKDSGSLWVVIDILRKNGDIKLLPFDVIQAVQKSGWHLHDILIWKKDKTIPFTHNGQMRNIFEYILFFTKSSKFKFYRERVTSINDLKPWWQKHPERYSTNGKSPTNIWDFPIPLQGSWGNRYIKHFCPLPEALIEQIIHLCSDVGDIVFDPFAGSGSVLAAAYRLNRSYLGCDLNQSYKKMFVDYIKKINPVDPGTLYQADTLKRFSKTIEKLRILKFSKKVSLQLAVKYPSTKDDIIAIFVLPTANTNSLPKNKFISCDYIFIVEENSKITIEQLKKIATTTPLSKYGIEANIKIVGKKIANRILSRRNLTNLWKYTNGITYKPGQKIGFFNKTLIEQDHLFKKPPIYSQVYLTEEELELPI